MQIKRIGLAALAAVAVIATVVMAQTSHPRTGAAPGTRHGMGMGPMIVQQLQLTPDQVTRFKALREEFMQVTQPTRDQLAAQMRDTALLWADGTSTPAQLKARADQIEPLKMQLRDTMIDYAVRARAVLTPDQLTKVREWITKNPNKGMGMLWGMGGGCPLMGEHHRGK